MNKSDQTAEMIARRQQEEYITRRVYNEYHWLNYWGEHSFNYLLFVNAGGVIAILTFMSIFKDKIKATSLAGLVSVLTLVCFVVGLVLVGLFSKYQYYFFKEKCKAIDEDSKSFGAGRLTFEEFLNKDAPRLKESRYGEKYALAAARCAFGGIVFGLFSFFAYNYFNVNLF